MLCRLHRSLFRCWGLVHSPLRLAIAPSSTSASLTSRANCTGIPGLTIRRAYQTAPASQQPFSSRPRHPRGGAAGTRPPRLKGSPQAAAAGAQVPEMEPAAKKQRVGGDDGVSTKQQQPQGKRKGKKLTPEYQARLGIHNAAKENDLAAALEVFDRAKAEGISLGPDLYLSVMYLCSGGDSWEQLLLQQAQAAGGDADAAPAAAAEAQQEQAAQQQGEQQGEQQGSGEAAEARPPPRLVDAAERHARALALFGEMKASGSRMAPTEVCYTAMARLEAAAGDPDRAFALAQEMVAAGVAPKLRSFTPALIAYAEAGRCDKAFEVDAFIAAQQLDLGQPEFARLLQAAAAGDSWQLAASVLRRVGAELTVLQPDTLHRVRQLFASPAAARAFEGSGSGQQGGRWEVVPTAVSPQGVCEACGGQLQALDLSAEEMETFSQGIAAIAESRERRPNDFQQFKSWLEAHGPFGAVIDGANVALFGQNFESGGFNFGQIRAVLNHLASRHPDLKPLLLLNIGRTKAPQARTPEAQALMAELRERHSFYVTPAGSNDDWYWIYAAVTAGEHGLLVSNDEMRDHIFQLLAPKYFLKWKQRHLLRYRFTLTGLELDYPAPFTTCTQELECGSWVFPGADGSWLCARRVTDATAAAGEAAARPAEGEAS